MLVCVYVCRYVHEYYRVYVLCVNTLLDHFFACKFLYNMRLFSNLHSISCDQELVDIFSRHDSQYAKARLHRLALRAIIIHATEHILHSIHREYGAHSAYLGCSMLESAMIRFYTLWCNTR